MTGRPDIAALDQAKDDRLTELTNWLAQLDGFGARKFESASADASFRRYFRVHGEESYILMDAPPPQEDCRPFVKIAAYLEQMGLNSPRVLQADVERGFLLLTDLGSTLYLAELERNPSNASLLYDDALNALALLQLKGSAYQKELPFYDAKTLHFELSIFHDWLCERHLGINLSDTEERLWSACCDYLIENALQQEMVFVHRDFHSRNLMVTDTNNPGIIDFQDAVEGPITYDLVSLLKDCYVKWPVEQIVQWAMSFYDRLQFDVQSKLDADTFLRQFDLMGVQRHLKAAGIFARLLHRDEKHGYMQDVPRTLSYIVDVAPHYAELEFLSDLISNRILPALERADG